MIGIKQFRTPQPFKPEIIKISSFIESPRIHEIIVVDDDPLITQMLKYILSDLGVFVREANSGEAAIELIEKLAFSQTKVSLVITDFNMGEINGA